MGESISALLKDGSEENLEGGERVNSQGIWMKKLQPHGGSEVGTWLAYLGNSKATVVHMERVRGKEKGDEMENNGAEMIQKHWEPLSELFLWEEWGPPWRQGAEE